MNILTLDGDIDYAKIVRSELIAQGVGGVFLATDPRLALDAFSRNRIDALIVEWFPDFVRFLRTAKRSPSPRVPIIMTSGRTRIQDILYARDSGINEFVAKPVITADLLQHLSHAVEISRRFVFAEAFTGPDRRRKSKSDFPGPERRQDEHSTPDGDDKPTNL